MPLQWVFSLINFLAVLALPCCTQALSRSGEQRRPSVAAHRLLTAVASHCRAHTPGAQAPAAAALRLWSVGHTSSAALRRV